MKPKEPFVNYWTAAFLAVLVLLVVYATAESAVIDEAKTTWLVSSGDKTMLCKVDFTEGDWRSDMGPEWTGLACVELDAPKDWMKCVGDSTSQNILCKD